MGDDRAGLEAELEMAKAQDRATDVERLEKLLASLDDAKSAAEARAADATPKEEPPKERAAPSARQAKAEAAGASGGASGESAGGKAGHRA